MEPSIEIIGRKPPDADKKIAYGTLSSQFGELRLPSSSGPFPVVVGIHGGWWRAAHGLETHSHVCAALTKAGFATWNIEYRRIGENTGGWPGTLNDVGSAIDFLQTIKNEYQLDLNRLITMGFSAGGHLAAWAALREHINPGSAIYTETPTKIYGCVSLAGALDLTLCQQLGLSNDVVTEFLQGTPQEVMNRYLDASPIELVSRSKTDVIFRLFHGTADTSVPCNVSQQFFNTAQKLGVNCLLSMLADTHHFELIDPDSQAWNKALESILELGQLSDS
jgi:acetyl esterase/lipase